MMSAKTIELAQLRLGVDPAEVSGLRDEYNSRLDHVLVAVSINKGLYSPSGELAALRIDRAYAVSCGFDCTGFVNKNMGGAGRDHRFVGLEKRGKYHKVCLGTT